tara:strand:+ start:302 stop:2197 length:1896 start_codon:yes stop_codon:yes gene_type:complete
MIEKIIYEVLNGIKRDFTIETGHFKLPIELQEKKVEISDDIKNDLSISNFDNSNNEKVEKDDLLDSKDKNIKELNTNVYSFVYNPETFYDNRIVEKLSNYYSIDKNFILDTQIVVENISSIDNYIMDKDYTILDVINNIEDVANDNNFLSNYQYIDLPYFNRYNTNSNILLMNSINNLINPVLTLIIPIIFMFLPFLIIKVQGLPVTMESYIAHLKSVFSRHVIGKLLFNFSESSASNKLYILFSFGMYIFQVYTNINYCIKFNRQIKDIYKKLHNLKSYLKDAITNFKNLIAIIKDLVTYESFSKIIKDNITVLENYYNRLYYIDDDSYNNKVFKLGNIMSSYYSLNQDKSLIESLYYSFDLNSYISCLTRLNTNIKNNVMNYSSIDNNKIKTNPDISVNVIVDNYYPSLLNKDNINNKDNSIVKNTVNLDKNLIITGPNASGKTTIIKSCLFNIILSQQIGCGFYKKANLKIYDYIYSYINIPDTSERDSLFQAEARRCKTIIDNIKENSDKNHFCIFDELYTGTNPDEAVKSAYGLIKYINCYNSVDFMLTTHFTKLCKQIEKDNKSKTANGLRVKNYKMGIDGDKDDNFKFTYYLVPGISRVKGGRKILSDLKYPETILETIKIDLQ